MIFGFGSTCLGFGALYIGFLLAGATASCFICLARSKKACTLEEVEVDILIYKLKLIWRVKDVQLFNEILACQ
jgi:hypothetical protein